MSADTLSFVSAVELGINVVQRRDKRQMWRKIGDDCSSKFVMQRWWMGVRRVRVGVGDDMWLVVQLVLGVMEVVWWV